MLSIIDRFGYELRRKDVWNTPKRPFSVLRYVIGEYLRTSDDFYFVDVASDVLCVLEPVG